MGKEEDGQGRNELTPTHAFSPQPSSTLPAPEADTRHCIDSVATPDHIFLMSKANAPSSEKSAVGTVPGPSQGADPKGSINLRIEARTRKLIDDAAAILGKTRTEFMIESARRHAIDVLLDQRLFMLDSERYGAFMHALDNPPAPGPKLRSLLRRVPAWRE